MVTEIIKTTLRLKRGLAEAWARNNPILLLAEPGFEYDTGKLKIGDGKTDWNNLPYFSNNDVSDNIKVVNVTSAENNLNNIIPKKDEYYLIKYENIPYVDNNKQKQLITLLVDKIGDGKTSLKNLKPLSGLSYGEGDGTVIQFLEADLYELVDEGTENARTSVSTAIGKGSMAGGRYNRTYGRESAAFNYNNIVHGEKSFATGQSNLIGTAAKYSFVNGLSNEAVSEAQVIIGTYANTEAGDAFVVGNGSAANGRRNAFRVDKDGNVYITKNIDVNNGQINAKNINVFNISAPGDSKVGSIITTERHWNFAENVVAGYGSAAIGGNNEVYGNNSLAAITSNIIPAASENGKAIEHVFIAGHNNTATYEHQVIVGTYSDPKPEDRFIVGNGYNNDPDNDPEKAVYQNAFVVETKGNIRIGGNQITLGSTSLTENELIKIKELVNQIG